VHGCWSKSESAGLGCDPGCMTRRHMWHYISEPYLTLVPGCHCKRMPIQHNAKCIFNFRLWQQMWNIKTKLDYLTTLTKNVSNIAYDIKLNRYITRQSTVHNLPRLSVELHQVSSTIVHNRLKHMHDKIFLACTFKHCWNEWHLLITFRQKLLNHEKTNKNLTCD